MVFDNSIINLQEDIRTFTFRDECGITIPKTWRERAWIQQIDIKITSIARNPYLSFRSNPANSQYGYAVLVMRDHSKIEIPITLARQRLYYGIVYDAFTNYYSLYYASITSSQLSAIANGLLVPIGTELGLSTSIPPLDCPVQPFWIELPIRELYVKCFHGTQFDIELSRWRMVTPLILGECAYDGKSGQVDGDKDAGLPSNGIQPNQASNPNSPFLGLPQPSSLSQLGEFANSKGESLNNVDPDNLPLLTIDPNKNYSLLIAFSVRYFNASNVPNGVTTTGQVFFPLVRGELLDVYIDPPPENIISGNFVGAVSADIKVRDVTGIQQGVLARTNINPPYPVPGVVTKFALIGIDSITPTEV